MAAPERIYGTQNTIAATPTAAHWTLGATPPGQWREAVSALREDALAYNLDDPRAAEVAEATSARSQQLHADAGNLPAYEQACVGFALLAVLTDLWQGFASREGAGVSHETIVGCATPMWIAAAASLAEHHSFTAGPARSDVTATLLLQERLLDSGLVPALASDSLLAAFADTVSADGPRYWLAKLEPHDTAEAPASQDVAGDGVRVVAAWEEVATRVLDDLSRDPKAWLWWVPVRRADDRDTAVAYANAIAVLADQLCHRTASQMLPERVADTARRQVVAQLMAADQGPPLDLPSAVADILEPQQLPC